MLRISIAASAGQRTTRKRSNNADKLCKTRHFAIHTIPQRVFDEQKHVEQLEKSWHSIINVTPPQTLGRKQKPRNHFRETNVAHDQFPNVRLGGETTTSRPEPPYGRGRGYLCVWWNGQQRATQVECWSEGAADSPRKWMGLPDGRAPSPVQCLESYWRAATSPARQL